MQDEDVEVPQQLDEPDEPEDEPEANEDWAHPYVPGQCNNIIWTDETGVDVVCGAPCNPNEQLCHDCRDFGHSLASLF